MTTWNPRPVTHHDLLSLLASGLALVAGALLVALPVALLDAPAPAWLGSAMAAVAYLAQWGVLFVLLRRRGWAWSDLGLNRLGRRGWHLLWQIPVGMVFALAGTILTAALVPGLNPLDDSTQDAQAAASGQTWLLILLVNYLLFGPFVEEIAFRRLLMGWLDRRMGVIAFTFFGGLVMAVLTRFHHSVWGGFAFHMVNNALASAGLILVLLSS